MATGHIEALKRGFRAVVYAAGDQLGVDLHLAHQLTVGSTDRQIQRRPRGLTQRPAQREPHPTPVTGIHLYRRPIRNLKQLTRIVRRRQRMPVVH
jgi:hypothetical protein